MNKPDDVPTGGQVILVVDDSEFIRTLSGSVLERSGYAVIGVASGGEALLWLETHPVSLVLLDYRLPDMTGVDLLRKLSKEGRKIPFIAITAHGDERVAVEMMKLGALDYLVKDQFFPDMLPSVVSQGLGHLEKERRLASAEAAARQSEQRYKRLSEEFQAVLDGIPDILILLSCDLKVIWANRAALMLFLQNAGGGGRACACFCAHDQDSCSQCPVILSFGSGSIEDGVIRRPEGSVWGVKAFPLKNPEGEVTRVIMLASDVTEKRRMREEVERAGRLAAVGELAAGVAHEINNPVGLILMNMPMLKAAFDDALPILEQHFSDKGEFLFGGLKYSKMKGEMPLLIDEILDGAQRIRHIVDDMKSFARGGQGKECSPFDLNAAVEKAVRLVGNQIRSATHNFFCLPADDLPQVKGNPQRIEQVLINLIINACQALPEKDRALEVATRFNAKLKVCEVIVRDEGVGVDQKDLAHLTDPFFTTRRENGGTGLGLSVSARIVRDHEGSLQFFSSPGKGTTVKLTLPAIVEEVCG